MRFVRKSELYRKNAPNPVFLNEEVEAKANVSSAATRRIASYQRALLLLPFVEEARDELAHEYDQKGFNKTISYDAIARWLNSRYVETADRNLLPPRGRTWSGKQVGKNIMGAPARIIEDAVLECRSRMTVLVLSADFTKPVDAVTELEKEYLGYIADAIDIEHRLNGNRERTREELMEEARHKAIEVAAMQRQRKPMSMMARERLWNNFPPIVQKVFEK